MAEVMNTWEAIREGASEVERLIGQKKYNSAMIKARQTLEIMVRTLAERNGIQVTNLQAAIDDLYRYRIISQSTAEHYQKIRMIGIKASQEGDENPSGANAAYHLLSQELYTFAKDFAPTAARRSRASSGSSGSSSRDSSYAGSGSEGGYSGSSRGGSGNGSYNSSRGGSGSYRSSRDIDEHNVRRASHRTSKKSGVTPELIFKIMIPVLALLLILGVVKLIKSQGEKEVVTEPELQIAVETTARETEPPTTVPETEPETVMVYTVNTKVLNVRSQPTTDSEKLGQVKEGETLQFISDYDADWALINYNDQEGYVSKQYVKAESMDPAALLEAAAEAEAEGGSEGEQAE